MPTKTVDKPARAASPAPGHVLSARFSDPDLVDRIFDYLVELLPDITARAPEVKAAIRDEFGGEEVYVRSGQAMQRAQRSRQTASEVLAMFNGRNATEVARRLGISRATVYRIIKQPGART